MDGVTGGYPDRREDEQPGIAPVDANSVTADQVAPAAPSAVQSTVRTDQSRERAPSVFDHYIDYQLAPYRMLDQLVRGGFTGIGKAIGGGATVAAVDDVATDKANLKRIEEIDAGGWPRPDDNQRVLHYAGSRKQRLELRKQFEHDAALPLEERWLYKSGNTAREWFKVEPGDPRYQIFYEVGIEAGKAAVVAPLMYVNPVLGTVVMIGVETGDQANEAIDDIKGDTDKSANLTDEQTAALIDYTGRSLLRNTVAGLPLGPGGAAGRNYIVRVIEGKVGKGGMRMMRGGAEAIGDAGEAGLLKVWENSDARATFDRGRNLGDDVLQSMLTSLLANVGTQGVKAGLETAVPATIDRVRAEIKNRAQSSHLYVEPEIGKAETAARLARDAASLAETVGDSLRSPRVRELHYDPLIDKKLSAGRKGLIGPEELQGLIDSGNFVTNKIDKLGLREKIAKAREDRTDVELSMSDLVKADAIVQNRFENVMDSFRFEKNGPTGRDAKLVVEKENARLKVIQERYRGSDPKAIEGGYAFKEIRKELVNRGMGFDEASRQAARRIELYEDHARRTSTDGKRESADTVYLREEYRKTQTLKINPRSNENLRREDGYVADKLKELGIATPGSSPRSGPHNNRAGNGKPRNHRKLTDAVIGDAEDDGSGSGSP